jgi:hypothetical protein
MLSLGFMPILKSYLFVYQSMINIIRSKFHHYIVAGVRCYVKVGVSSKGSWTMHCTFKCHIPKPRMLCMVLVSICSQLFHYNKITHEILLFEVMATLAMKTSSLVKVDWRFWGTYRFYLQDWRISQARNQTLLSASCWCLASLTFWPCIWRWYVPPKHWSSRRTIQRYVSNYLICKMSEGVIFQDLMMVILIFT